MHSLIIRAQQSDKTRVLQKLLDQWDDFLKTLEGFTDIEEAEFIKSFLIEQKLLEGFNTNIELLKLPVEDIRILFSIDHPTARVYFFLVNRLAELGFCRLYLYQFRSHQEPQMVLVWKEDLKLVSKRIKQKLVPVRVEK